MLLRSLQKSKKAMGISTSKRVLGIIFHTESMNADLQGNLQRQLRPELSKQGLELKFYSCGEVTAESLETLKSQIGTAPICALLVVVHATSPRYPFNLEGLWSFSQLPTYLVSLHHFEKGPQAKWGAVFSKYKEPFHWHVHIKEGFTESSPKAFVDQKSKDFEWLIHNAK